MEEKNKTTPDIMLEVVLDTNKEKSFVATRSRGLLTNKENVADGAIVENIVTRVKELSALNKIPVSDIPVVVEGAKQSNELREALKDKGIKALQKTKKDKDYYYDYYDDYYYEPLTPYGVINFDDLEQAEAARELNNDYLVLFAQYAEMAQRIINGDYYLEFGDERGKLSLMTDLTQQFLNRLEKVTAEKGNVRKELNSTEQIEKDATEEPVIEVEEKSIEESLPESVEKDYTNIISSNNGVILSKNKNGELIWAGVHTNKFQDRDGDILTEAAHKQFVEKVYSGDYEFPQLWIWHIPKAVGEVNWMEYDERGFLLSGGKIYKEYEELVTSLVSNTPEMGMSHGMPVDSLVYDEEHCIKEYRSIEVSMLPLDDAANILTEFKVGKNNG